MNDNDDEYKMTKQKLIAMFDMAISMEDEFRFVIVELTLPKRTATEIILVKPENFEYKRDYYLNAYDDEMRLKTNNEIKIVNVYISSIKDLPIYDDTNGSVS